MNPFSLINLIIIGVNLPISIFLLIKGRGRASNILLAYLCLAAVLWGLGSYNYSVTASRETAIFWWQIANVGSILSTVLFYYFILAYLEIKRPVLSFAVNLLTLFYLVLNFFDKDAFIGDLKFIFNQFYYISWP